MACDKDIVFNNLQGFYYYQNWTAGQDNKIHIHDCGFCCYGSGTSKEQDRGLNGAWVGPFDNKTLAKDMVKRYFDKDAAFCFCCAKL